MYLGKQTLHYPTKVICLGIWRQEEKVKLQTFVVYVIDFGVHYRTMDILGKVVDIAGIPIAFWILLIVPIQSQWQLRHNAGGLIIMRKHIHFVP